MEPLTVVAVSCAAVSCAAVVAEVAVAVALDVVVVVTLGDCLDRLTKLAVFRDRRPTKTVNRLN